ncbi:MAG: anti-sigma factor [Saprospiraceae bacterium]
MKELINIQEYIESGILEQYAMGLTSIEQNQQIQEYLLKYPVIKSELSKIEETLENYSKQFSKPLSAGLKSKIMDQINNQSTVIKSSGNYISNIVRYAAILILAASSFYFWKLNQDTNTNLQSQIKQNEFMQIQKMQDSLALLDCNTQLAYLRNNNHNRVILKGTEKFPQAIAMIYYDKTTQRILLDVVDLPKHSIEKQYQLWAIVDGKPVDLGVLDLDQTGQLKEIKFVDKAQAFAITLEPKGGLASPTMDQMYVIGTI